MTDKEIEILSQEIMQLTNRLNLLIGKAASSNLLVDVEKSSTQAMGQKWPQPFLQITVLKEV